jgi:hypothetical protein
MRRIRCCQLQHRHIQLRAGAENRLLWLAVPVVMWSAILVTVQMAFDRLGRSPLKAFLQLFEFGLGQVVLARLFA